MSRLLLCHLPQPRPHGWVLLSLMPSVVPISTLSRLSIFSSVHACLEDHRSSVTTLTQTSLHPFPCPDVPPPPVPPSTTPIPPLTPFTGSLIRHAPRWAVYTTNFALFTFIIKHNSRWHNKMHWRTARPRTQNRNAAHGGDTQRAQHPQTRQSKTTANGPRRIASQHGELASAEAATHVSLRRPREDVGILLEGALRLAIR